MNSATPLEFVSAVAHDLKPPIAALEGAVSALRRGRGLDAAVRDRLLGVIADAAEQLGATVEILLSAGDLEAGQPQVELRACDAAGIAEAAVQAARAAWTGADRVALAVAHGVPAVRADPLRLRQVVASLLDNALRHGGRTGSVDVRVDAAAGRVTIAVSDEGPGIAAADIERIFERYVRSESGGGSGLGLYLARGLVRAMGGRIGVVSTPGHGATFTVELPAA